MKVNYNNKEYELNLDELMSLLVKLKNAQIVFHKDIDKDNDTKGSLDQLEYAQSDVYDWVAKNIEGDETVEEPKHQVVWKVYTQSYSVFGESEELTWEEDNVEEYDSLEKAQRESSKNKYGWFGTYVEVYIDDEYERDYVVE